MTITRVAAGLLGAIRLRLGPMRAGRHTQATWSLWWSSRLSSFVSAASYVAMAPKEGKVHSSEHPVSLKHVQAIKQSRQIIWAAPVEVRRQGDMLNMV